MSKRIPSDAPGGVEGELAVREHVARLLVGEEHLRAGAGPLHRAAERFRREERRAVFRVEVEAHAEAAADFLGDHADLFRRHAEHGRELVAHDRRALRARIEVVHPLFRQVRGEAGARLHRISDHARVVHAQPDHPRRVRQMPSSVSCLVAGFEIQDDVARHRLVHQRSAGRDGLLGRDHRRQLAVFDADELGRVLRRDSASRRPRARRRRRRSARALARAPAGPG